MVLHPLDQFYTKHIQICTSRIQWTAHAPPAVPLSHKCFEIIKMQGSLREEKQQYLRQTILESDHDPQEFMDFCENLKGSVDIDSWSLQELQQIVRQFVSSKKGPFEYQQTNSSQIPPIDWDNVFQQPSSKPPTPSVNLNIIDIDFLQTMGTNSPSLSAKPVPKAEPVRQEKTSSDPSKILTKLNDKNNDFISAYNSYAMQTRDKEKLKPEQSQTQSPTIKKQIRQPQPQSVLVPAAKDNLVLDEHFRSTVKCRSFANQPRVDQRCEVTVTGHQTVNPNPFVPNYVLYSITTSPPGTEVKRRLKDFQMLRNMLRKIFPNVQIPYLERYGRRLSETEPLTIRKQKLFLESFLNNLLMNKALRCKILDDFLLCQNADSLKKIFRELEKLEKPKCIQDLYSLSGKLEVDFSPQHKKYINQQQLYLDYLQPNLVKLKQLYDQLATSLANSVRIINQISELYDNLRDSTKNVNNLVGEQLKTTQLEVHLDKISDLHKHWALSMKTQAKVVEVEVRHFCRYETANIDTIREITKVANSLVEAYAKRSDKAEAAKEQYEYNKKLSDYKKDVESPSKVLRHQAGHYLSHTVHQLYRYLNNLSDKLLRKFRTFATLQLNISADLQSSWKQFETFAAISL